MCLHWYFLCWLVPLRGWCLKCKIWYSMTLLVGLMVSCDLGVQMTRCLSFRELSFLCRHAWFIVITIDNWFFQFQVPLDFQGCTSACRSKPDALPCNCPEEAGSWPAMGLAKNTAETNRFPNRIPTSFLFLRVALNVPMSLSFLLPPF